MLASIEAGLPGTGREPIHLHTGHPTPWSEGVVLRIISNNGNDWFANTQIGRGYATKLVTWESANALVAIIGGAVYVINPDDPNDWKLFDTTGIDCVVSDQHSLAFITTYTDVIAIHQSRREA